MNQVYFLQVGDYVKIGYSYRPEHRARTILNGSQLLRPDDIDRHAERVLLRTLPNCECKDERAIHAMFADSRVVGEWFRNSPALRRMIADLDYTPIADQLRAAARARRLAKAHPTAAPAPNSTAGAA
jgi:hypothetical protein